MSKWYKIHYDEDLYNKLLWYFLGISLVIGTIFFSVNIFLLFFGSIPSEIVEIYEVMAIVSGSISGIIFIIFLIYYFKKVRH